MPKAHNASDLDQKLIRHWPAGEIEGSYFLIMHDSRAVRSSSTNAVNNSSARTIKRFPSSRCASAIQIVRPLERRFLEQSEEFEDDHDNENHSNYVQEGSGHAGRLISE